MNTNKTDSSCDAIIHTEIAVKEYSMLWRIDNFSVLPDELECRAFSPCSNFTIHPRLHFKNEYMNIEIALRTTVLNTIKLKCDIWLMNSDGKEFESKSCVFTFNDKNNKFQFNFYTFNKKNVIQNRSLKPYDVSNFLNLLDDVLLLKFNFKISGQDIHTKLSAVYSIMHRLTLLSDDLRKLYMSELHSDITLCVNGNKVPAHKVILQARSPVFAKMFEHAMLEKTGNCVTITDIELPVMKSLLAYLYTGEVVNMTFAEASDLYVAANKYLVAELMEICAQFLLAEITIDRACEIFELADRCDDDQLKNMAGNFFSKNIYDIMKTEKWNNFLIEKPQVVIDVLKSHSSENV